MHKGTNANAKRKSSGIRTSGLSKAQHRLFNAKNQTEKENNIMDVARENYYALLLAIVYNKSAQKALNMMGLASLYERETED